MEKEENKQEEMIKEIAENISALSQSVQKLLGGKLTRKAIILLLAHSTSMPQYRVDDMLIALENLEKDWTK